MESYKIQQSIFLIDMCNNFNCTNRGTYKERYSHFCSYSAGCTIGKHLSPELCAKLDSSETVEEFELLFKEFPQWMQNLGSEFLLAAQSLHDCPTYWNEQGLSDQGIRFRDYIVKEFGLNDD